MQWFESFQRRGAQQLAIASAITVLTGCANSHNAHQVTDHWASQNDIAGNAYRDDIMACSHSAKDLSAHKIKFSVYEACMQERGYSLVVAESSNED